MECEICENIKKSNLGEVVTITKKKLNTKTSKH